VSPRQREAGCFYNFGHTDATDLIKFNLGSGTYVILVSNDYLIGNVPEDIYKFDEILNAMAKHALKRNHAVYHHQ